MIKSCRCDATVSKVTKTCSFPKLNQVFVVPKPTQTMSTALLHTYIFEN